MSNYFLIELFHVFPVDILLLFLNLYYFCEIGSFNLRDNVSPFSFIVLHAIYFILLLYHISNNNKTIIEVIAVLLYLITQTSPKLHFHSVLTELTTINLFYFGTLILKTSPNHKINKNKPNIVQSLCKQMELVNSYSRYIYVSSLNPLNLEIPKSLYLLPIIIEIQ